MLYAQIKHPIKLLTIEYSIFMICYRLADHVNVLLQFVMDLHKIFTFPLSPHLLMDAIAWHQ